MNSGIFDEPFVPICVTEYRKLHPIAGKIIRARESPPSEYIEMLDDISEHLAPDFVCPKENPERMRYYETNIEKAIVERNPARESLIKCARYMERICDIAVDLNEYIYKIAGTAYESLSNWCKYHEQELDPVEYLRSMYHLYFFISSFIEEVVTSSEEVRNIMIDLKINADRSMFDYVGDFTSEWSEYKSKYPNYVVSPDILIGRDLHIESADSKKNKENISKLLHSNFPEKGLITIILGYMYDVSESNHFLDIMINSVRNDLNIFGITGGLFYV